MNDTSHHTVDSEDVHSFCLELLASLTPESHRLQQYEIYNVLLFAASKKVSIHQAAQDLDNSLCGRSVRDKLAQLFDDLEVAEKKNEWDSSTSYSRASEKEKASPCEC